MPTRFVFHRFQGWPQAHSRGGFPRNKNKTINPYWFISGSTVSKNRKSSEPRLKNVVEKGKKKNLGLHTYLIAFYHDGGWAFQADRLKWSQFPSSSWISWERIFQMNWEVDRPKKKNTRRIYKAATKMAFSSITQAITFPWYRGMWFISRMQKEMETSYREAAWSTVQIGIGGPLDLKNALKGTWIITCY